MESFRLPWRNTLDSHEWHTFADRYRCDVEFRDAYQRFWSEMPWWRRTFYYVWWRVVVKPFGGLP